MSRHVFAPFGIGRLMPGSLVSGLLMSAAILALGACSPPKSGSSSISESLSTNAREAEQAEEEVARLAAAARESQKGEHTSDAKKSQKSSKKDAHKSAKSHRSSTGDAKSERKPASRVDKAQASARGKEAFYIVQVGAYRVKENAERMHAKLKGEGLPVIFRPMNHSKNGSLFLVRFEPTPNRTEADSWASQVKAKAGIDTQLIRQYERE